MAERFFLFISQTVPYALFCTAGYAALRYYIFEYNGIYASPASHDIYVNLLYMVAFFGSIIVAGVIALLAEDDRGDGFAVFILAFCICDMSYAGIRMYEITAYPHNCAIPFWGAYGDCPKPSVLLWCVTGVTGFLSVGIPLLLFTLIYQAVRSYLRQVLHGPS
jgi:hypothetical protein